MARIAPWVACLLALVPMGCGHETNPTGFAAGIPVVRVLVFENQQQVTVSASESPMVRVGPSAALRRLELPANVEIPVILNAKGWQIGTELLGAGELTLEPAAIGSLRIEKHAYRGRYRLVPTSGGKFDVVNDVDVESYLQGVLARELLPTWQPEAYKAQGIAARTYALYEARTSGGGRQFDLYADQRSQVYGGIAAETSKSRDAVEATRGVVLASGPAGQERIFKAYFSSCCGGITQSATDAFGDPSIEPLSDQNIGPRCIASPRFNWGPVVISRPELTRRIRAWGIANNRAERYLVSVARIDAQYANRWGRPIRFLLTDSRGARFSLSGEELRRACNTDAHDGNTLGSSFFRPVTDERADTIRFEDGHGFGHGVGLCQWCAETEARRGERASQIVLAAFPSAKLLRAY